MGSNVCGSSLRHGTAWTWTPLIGNANAPYVNHLAQTYGLASNYYEVAHPSQPN